ncbi:hypothetical protein GDO78_023154 [Eleutherodactylus coqui]|uniref:Uncharacterized protein n=1 Tax=Eleutherodactylus coqui TaxID=57060 RepID=A0A8J6JY39_ELECQ|nr:hypothetical protein GDO78_023154 [Eleutherodactylus coqui]
MCMMVPSAIEHRGQASEGSRPIACSLGDVLNIWCRNLPWINLSLALIKEGLELTSMTPFSPVNRSGISVTHFLVALFPQLGKTLH